MSTKQRLIEYFLKNVGTDLDRDALSEVSGTHSWQRVVRTLRQEGWDIVATNSGYILKSIQRKEKAITRLNIGGKLRYEVLQRDNSRCQRCGKTVDDGIKLEVDHKIPVEWGGSNDLANLWTLCNICNGGKKHFFSDFDADQMKTVMNEPSGKKRIKLLFELNPDQEISIQTLSVISSVRDWERTLRSIRSDEGMNIQWLKKTVNNPNGAYIYHSK